MILKMKTKKATTNIKGQTKGESSWHLILKAIYKKAARSGNRERRHRQSVKPKKPIRRSGKLSRFIPKPRRSSLRTLGRLLTRRGIDSGRSKMRTARIMRHRPRPVISTVSISPRPKCRKQGTIYAALSLNRSRTRSNPLSVGTSTKKRMKAARLHRMYAIRRRSRTIS